MTNKEAMALIEELGGDPQTMYKWRNNGVRFYRRDGDKAVCVYTLHKTEVLNCKSDPYSWREGDVVSRKMYTFSTGGYDTKTTCSALRELCATERLPFSFAIKKGKIVMAYYGIGRDIKFDTTINVMHETGRRIEGVTSYRIQIVPDTGDVVQTVRWV
jgi:hypothetical protein